jgi:hypothetical protein
MSRERIESLAAAGLLLLGCASCWLLFDGALRVEVRSAARMAQLRQFEELRQAPLRRDATGQLPTFDGLFGERAVCRVDTRFGKILAVVSTRQVP